MSNLPKAKQLTFSEMWQLYRILKNTLPEKDEVYYVNELSKIVSKITNQEFLNSLHLMYGKKLAHRKESEFAVLFIQGLDQTKFFDFVTLARNISG